MDWSQVPKTPVSFDLDTTEGTDAPAIIEDGEDTAVRDNPSAEFLCWYHKLNHMLAAKMQAMARQGLLPKKLAKYQLLTCTSCLYGRATRRPWRTKPRLGHQGGKLQAATESGQCVNVLTISAVCLIFICRRGPVQKRQSSKAKIVFERFASKVNVKVKSYQANNGQFAENKFVEAVKEAGQTIIFCEVNAHFQNAVAERRIRTFLQDQARTMLIHAQHRWPKAIDAHLWPFVFRVTYEVHNSTPSVGREDHKSSFELFARSEVTPSLNHFQCLDVLCLSLTTRCNQARNCPKGRSEDCTWESTMACQCNMHTVLLLCFISRQVLSHLSFMSRLTPSLRRSGSLLEIYLHPQNGRRCVVSRPHHLPGFMTSSKQLKLKVCNMMSLHGI